LFAGLDLTAGGCVVTNWQLSGDYFENCNCSVVCPCLISPAPPLTSRPTEGVCDVALAFHIDKGSYGTVALDGLNLALIAHTPGPMADGNWTIAIYIDQRATDEQAVALGAVFGGAEGGPMAAFAPLIATNLGVSKVPITYRVTGKTRSAEIPGVMNMSVEPLPSLRERGNLGVGRPSDRARQAGASGRQGRQHLHRPRNALGQFRQEWPLRADKLVQSIALAEREYGYSGRANPTGAAASGAPPEMRAASSVAGAG
jgi:hypothetical protein